MSAASRLAAAETRFVRPRDERTGQFRAPAELARNRAQIPGALGVDLPGPVQACGIEWLPVHGSPWASPIGAQLAVEMAAGQE